jgi:hypothetical protein
MLAFQSSIQFVATQAGLGLQAQVPAIGTASILGAIIGGVLKLPIAKTLNLWGRAEAWFLFLGVYIVGIIILATFDGTAGYSAGYTLYWIGYDAIYLICDIFIADTSGLRNRAFSFAFIFTPFVGCQLPDTIVKHPLTCHRSSPLSLDHLLPSRSSPWQDGDGLKELSPSSRLLLW